MAKPRRETMVSRSERIIGRQLQEDSQNDDQSTENSTDQSSASRRRGQVLKAQRAHRRRTQNYIQELEKEVLRLRNRENELTAELALRPSQPESHASHSPYLGDNDTDTDYSSIVHTPESPMIHVNLTRYADIQPGYGCPIQAAFGVQTLPFSQPSEELITAITNSFDIQAGVEQDSLAKNNAQSAIDFILDLEGPCLSHIKFDMTSNQPTPFKEPNFNYGRSHACTVSSQIIQSHQNDGWADHEISVPHRAVENLLTNSKSLPLGPEMTPVQVWTMLSDLGLSVATVSLFKEELRKYMRCNAFGTTVPIDTLRQLLNACFPWYDTAHLYDVKVGITASGAATMTEIAGDGWAKYF